MTILLSNILHGHSIPQYANCCLPNDSIVRKIDYKLDVPENYGNAENLEKHCTHKYYIYRKNNIYTLYKRNKKNKYLICFEREYIKRRTREHPEQCTIM